MKWRKHFNSFSNLFLRLATFFFFNNKNKNLIIVSLRQNIKYSLSITGGKYSGRSYLQHYKIQYKIGSSRVVLYFCLNPDLVCQSLYNQNKIINSYKLVFYFNVTHVLWTFPIENCIYIVKLEVNCMKRSRIVDQFQSETQILSFLKT